ncbi:MULTISPECIES: LysR family transcriptional regulator [Sphingobium]|jgi:DNA-binding transcriptional LysR family regulator|uniref:LysR family transcriptional regulator n=1 Tax=Sphingobium TaxID=165695 RepID=UPI000E77043E|nr:MULTISPECIES: LysR family transcriptional regulator [Sphingobium]KAA9016551.1 LysR family transcriptional regulator [Sphingobium limneticum]MBU0931564.1 LysR family transcriptional regulator [Alphaproteobacteria bacterium]
MMDPDHELFVTVVDEGGLAAAGRRLHISPAMMSKRLARLEERLGARLLHRTTRRLALTPAGERLHADLRGILAALDDAERRVSGTSAVASGPLRITAPTSFGRMHLAPYLHRFIDAHPRVELSVDLSDDYADLIESRADLAIRITADPGSGLIARRLATNRRILCAAPAYLARHGTPATIADLKSHRLLAAEGQMPWRLVGPKRPVLVEGRSHVRTNSSELVRELTLAGGGIALRSLWDISTALERGEVRQILPDHEGSADVGLFAVQLPQPNPPLAITAFVDFLVTLYVPTPPWERAGLL